MTPLRKFETQLNPIALGLPAQSLQIDWSHPLARNISFAAVMHGLDVHNLAAQELSSYVTNIPANFAAESVTAGSSCVEELTPYGPGLLYPGVDSNGKTDFGNAQVITENDFTVLVIANPAASGSLNQTAFSQRSATSQIDIIFNSNVANATVSGQWALFVLVPGNGTALGADTTAGLVDGNYHAFVSKIDAGTTSCWTDGILTTSASNASVPNPWASNHVLALGGLAGTTIDAYMLASSMPLCLVWNGRGLTADEIASISADPWQIFTTPEADMSALQQSQAGLPLMAMGWM